MYHVYRKSTKLDFINRIASIIDPNSIMFENLNSPQSETGENILQTHVEI